MAQAVMQAQKIKKELEKVKEKIKKEKFTFESEVVRLVMSGERNLIALSIKEGHPANLIERELLKAHKELESEISQFTTDLMKPYANFKDLL